VAIIEIIRAAVAKPPIYPFFLEIQYNMSATIAKIKFITGKYKKQVRTIETIPHIREPIASP